MAGLRYTVCCCWAITTSPSIITRSAGADANRPNSHNLTPLHLASEKGHNEIARLLFDHGADANHPDSGGRTPLHLASERGHDEIIRILFDHGADANHPDAGGMTPTRILRR